MEWTWPSSVFRSQLLRACPEMCLSPSATCPSLWKQATLTRAAAVELTLSEEGLTDIEWVSAQIGRPVFKAWQQRLKLRAVSRPEGYRPKTPQSKG